MKNTLSINVTPKAVAVVNGKNKVEVPYVSTAKGVKWYVSKACNRDYIAIGFKTYANGERRANIYLHDYSNKFASLKTADGKPLETIAKATPMVSGKKYTVTNLSPEGLKNFAVMFVDFEKARQTDSKQADKGKPTAKASKPDSKPTASPKASKTADKPTASKTADKPKASPKTAPKTSPKASKPTDSKTADSKPDSKPTADSKTA